MTNETVFLDFEASGLGPGGFPIEWGVAILSRDTHGVLDISTVSCLIRPEPEWLAAPAAWDPAAETIHGVALRTLEEEGVPAPEAARRLEALLRGKTAHADSPAKDGVWAAMLMAAGGIEASFRVRDVGTALEQVTDLGYEHGVRTATKTAPRTHRAGDDARYWAVVLKEALENPDAPRGPSVGRTFYLR